MAHQTKGLHHYHTRKRIHKKHQKYPHPDKVKRVFDKLIYVVGILGPIMNLPQLFKIWAYKNAAGVSFISWISFSIISLIWFIYGWLHKERPIMVMFSALMVIQALIAIGAIIYR